MQEFDEQHFIVMGTRKGTVKKTELSAFSNPRAGGIIAMGIEDDDAVMAVQLSDGDSEIFIGTRLGMAIRFHESRRPAAWAARPTASAASSCAKATRSSPWKSSSPAGRC